MGGPLSYQELLEAWENHPEYKDIKTFIETGTFQGDTCLKMAEHFDQVHTVEVCKELYEAAVQRSKREGVKNVNFFWGDSVEFLKELESEPAVYFLDAHISGPGTGTNGQYIVPLISELRSIVNRSDKTSKMFLIFDDLRFFEGHEKHSVAPDWRGVSTQNIVDTLRAAGYTIEDSYEKNDRFFVFCKS